MPQATCSPRRVQAALLCIDSGLTDSLSHDELARRTGGAMYRVAAPLSRAVEVVVVAMVSLALFLVFVPALQVGAIVGWTAKPPAITVKEVEAELKLALSQERVVGTLTPSLAQVTAAPLTAMGPSPLNTRCWPTRAQTTVPLCQYGDLKSKITVLLTGDSQAFMWEPAFGIAGKILGFRVVMMIKALCPAEVVPTSYWYGTPYPQCTEFHAFLNKWVSVHKPRLIFAAGRSPELSAGYSDAFQIAQEFLTMRKEFHSPKSLVYLLPLTVDGSDPPACVSAYISAVNRCAVQRSSGYFESTVDQGIAIAVASKQESTIPAVSLLCTAKSCPVVSRNFLIYTDNDHVSRKWMWHIGPALADLLRPVLKRLPHTS